MATDKKAVILAALNNNVDPPPQELIDELTAVTDVAAINRKINMWMGRPKEDWEKKRPEDGADIYNALHPNQGTLQHAMRVTNFTQGQRRR
jgi:hypothetical protein